MVNQSEMMTQCRKYAIYVVFTRYGWTTRLLNLKKLMFIL